MIIPTVESVLSQSITDLEYIIVDDGSNDDTPCVVQGLASRDRRISYVRQENSGGASARAFGLSLAQGEYIAFLDHDDRWKAEKLSRQVQFLDKHPEFGGVYSKMAFIDENATPRGMLRVRHWSGWIQSKLIVYQNFIGSYSNPMFRASLFELVGGPDPAVGMSDDWDLFIRLAGVAPIGLIDEPLVMYNTGNSSSQSRNMAGAVDCETRVLQKHRALIARLGGGDRMVLRYNMRRRRAGMLRIAGWFAQSRGELQEAAGLYAQAALMDPSVFMSWDILKDLGALVKRCRRQVHD